MSVGEADMGTGRGPGAGFDIILPLFANPLRARNQLLFHAFFRREITSRYVGSVSGLLWAVANPLAQLAVLSFVFSHIFRVTSGPATHGLAYISFVAVALWPWIMFSESVTRGLGSITGNADLVRKVAFPHVLLVAASVAATYAVNLAGMAAVLVVLAFVDPALHLAGLPAVLLLMVPHFVLSFAVAAALAALQAFIRDVSHVIGVLLSILFYATPIVYPASLVPESMAGFLDWNPHAHFAERFRQALTGGDALAASDLGLAAACALVALACWLFFRRLSPYFEELV